MSNTEKLMKMNGIKSLSKDKDATEERIEELEAALIELAEILTAEEDNG